MISPLTKVLVNVFAKGFYRVHSGLLLFLFVSVFSYFFFINTAGDVPPDVRLLYQIMLTLKFVSSPVMTVMVFMVWMFYTVKSWKYIAGQLKLPAQQFLFYSVTSFSRTEQFRSWFIVQLVISVPMAVYGLVASVIGIFFHYYIIPVIIPLFMFLLALISAGRYVYQVNRLSDEPGLPYLLRLAGNWRKPLFSLFIYQVFDKLKFTYLLIKLLSWTALTGMFLYFRDVKDDWRPAAIGALSVGTAHAVLIYRKHRFEENYLSLVRNLPYSIGSRFIQAALLNILLILPESFWLLYRLPEGTALELIVFALGMLLLFNSLLYSLNLQMGNYLIWVFGLFILLFLLIMFGLSGRVTIIVLPLSFLLFCRNYYRKA